MVQEHDLHTEQPWSDSLCSATPRRFFCSCGDEDRAPHLVAAVLHARSEGQNKTAAASGSETLPEGWEATFAGNGKRYYYNVAGGFGEWALPS